MKAMDFARSIIEGTGGLNDFENREIVIFHNSDRVTVAHWTLKCLANPDCEGSEEAVQAILKARRQRTPVEVISTDQTSIQ